MKKKSMFFISSILIILLAALATVLSGCDVSFVKDGDETEPISDISTNPDASESVILPEENTNQAENKPNSSSSTSIFEAEPQKNKGINKERITNAKDKTEQNEEEILATDKFIIKGRIDSDDEIIPYHVARSGNKTSLHTEMKGVKLGLISTESAMYIISSSKKVYSDVPETLKNSLKEELEKTTSKEERVLVSEGSEVVDGITLKYKKYDDKSIDYTYKGILVMQISYDSDGKKSTLYVDEVSDEISDSDFIPPSSFKKVSLSDFVSAVSQ